MKLVKEKKIELFYICDPNKNKKCSGRFDPNCGKMCFCTTDKNLSSKPDHPLTNTEYKAEYFKRNILLNEEAAPWKRKNIL